MQSDIIARLAALSPEKRALLERRLRASETNAAARMGPCDASQRQELSFAQRRLWFLDQLEPAHGFYNLPMVMGLEGGVDTEKLSLAINEIVRRHEVLRTVFFGEDGEPYLESLPELTIEIKSHDLTKIPADRRHDVAGETSVAVALQPFDLRWGPLVRADLLCLSRAEHILVVTMHHIVADGWSLGVFRRELDEIYGALLNGKRSRLPPLAMQYADYSAWQRQYLKGAVFEGLIRFWKRTLDQLPALLELPTDRPRPKVQSFDGSSLTCPYDKPAVDALAQFAMREGATMFMALLAVFKILLHRFSGLTDIAVGAPVANRDRVELEGLIGLFVNTIVLRTGLEGDPSFREVLARVRVGAIDAFAHQDLPFDRLVEELNPERNMGHSPLFQVMFGMQNADRDVPRVNAPKRLVHGPSKFDLTASASPTAEGLTVTYEFNSTLFDSSTIESLAEGYGALIEAVVQNPDMMISRLPLVGGERKAELITAATAHGPVPEASTLTAWFDTVAARIPDAPALEAGGEALSYAETRAAAERLAQALIGAGVRSGMAVGLCLERTLDLPLAMLGILKAGGAFLPLDPAHPPERLSFMMREAGVKVVLTADDLRARLPDHDATVLCAGEIARSKGGANPGVPCGEVHPDGLAYVIYTSGSTGRPKGVMVTHRGASNAVQTQIEAFALPEGTRILQFGSLSFDICIYDLLMMIGCGGTLCMAPAETIMPGPDLADTLRRLRISAVTLPPSSLNVVPETYLPDLRLIVCGGEALAGEVAERWLSPGRRVVNAYGPTETTIWATCADCVPGEGAPPIGNAVSRIAAYVLDNSLEPLPPGFPGELYIGGDGVARGYLCRPDLTADGYVPDPHAGTPGARMYRTGDRVVIRTDGAIRFLGRRDHQVKLRGYRIELGEVESMLVSHPAVRESAVVMQTSDTGKSRLTAYCALQDGSAALGEDLLEHLRRHLPEYMVPSILQIIGALPVSASGKVDRRSLSEWTEIEGDGDGGVDEPIINGTEAVVARIFAEVLEVRNVGPGDSFFSLGGHSLLATRAVTRMNEAFGIALPLRTLFENPRVGDLARIVERNRASGLAKTLPSLVPAHRNAVNIDFVRSPDSSGGRTKGI